jgi:ABC-2 type transport system permease protein
MPKVLFVTGDLERNIYKRGEREYAVHSTAIYYRSSLINIGFDADTISPGTQDIPSDVTALVLADPKMDLSANSISKIRQYIDKGGNMLILGEPGKQYVLNPLLQHLGVQLMNGILVEPSKDEMPQMVFPYITPACSNLAQENTFLRMKRTGDSIRVLMPGATAIAYAHDGAFSVNPLLITDGQQSWLKAGRLVTDSTAPVYSPQEGDIKGIFPTALALTRQVNNKQQRIIICGDADFMSNSRVVGSFLTRGIYSWLDEGKFPNYTPRPDPKDNKLKIKAEGVEMLKIIYIWVLPVLILIGGTILLIRRKRK